MDRDDIEKEILAIAELPRPDAGERIANFIALIQPHLDTEEREIRDRAAKLKGCKDLIHGFTTLMCVKQREESIEQCSYTTSDGLAKITVKATTSKVPSVTTDDKDINVRLVAVSELVTFVNELRGEEDAALADILYEAFVRLDNSDRSFVRVSSALDKTAIKKELQRHAIAAKDGKPIVSELPELLEGKVRLGYSKKDNLILGEDVDIR